MPLTEIVRNLNRRNRSQAQNVQLDEAFVATEHGVMARYGDVHIESDFDVLTDYQGRVQGQVAQVRAYGAISRQALNSSTVFMLAQSDNEFIYLDRLIRTLHILNYLYQRMSGKLLLKLHPRLVQTAMQHRGVGFDEILHSCGLQPENVIFEFEMDSVANLHALKQAIEMYRARGYGIAVSRFEVRAGALLDLRDIRPDIIRLDSEVIHTSGELHALSKAIHATGAKILASGKNVGSDQAARAGIDLLQLSSKLNPVALGKFSRNYVPNSAHAYKHQLKTKAT